MSGYKRATVNISQDEYDRLRDADLKLRALPDAAPELFTSITQQSNGALQANLEQMQQRQSEFEHLIAGMDQYIRDLESSTTQAMLTYEESAVAQAQSYSGCLWDYFNQVIQSHAEQFETIISANHGQYQQALTQHSRQIRRMAVDQDEKRALANQWLEAAEGFCLFIKQYYQHDVFTPGRLERLENNLIQARQNLETGLSEAVILTSQQLYTAFSDLRIDLEQLQNEWTMLFQATKEACLQICLQGENSQVVQAVDLDGNVLPYQIDVNVWTQGRLSQWQNEMGSIRSCLESPDRLPDSETLQRWLTVDLPGYYKALEDIVLDARISALNSQLRINIADLVVQVLQQQGFALAESNYEALDMRSTFQASLTNLEGNEVIVQVSPVGQELGANELHLQSFDKEERTEHELQQRWYEVSQSLTQVGLDVGAYVREDSPAYRTNQRSVSRPKKSQHAPKPGMNIERTDPDYGD